MERDFAGSQLSLSDFERLAAVCRNDPKFPKTYSDWQRLVADGVQQLAVDARTAPEYAIDPSTFLFWSQRVGIMPCLDGLRAYLIIHRGPAASASPAAEPTPALAPKASDDGTSTRRIANIIANLFPLPAPAWG